MKTADFDFDLPEEHIALRPAEPRDSARLLVVKDGALDDRIIRDLPDFLQPGDALVFNDTRVIPARLSGVRQRRGPEGETLTVEVEVMRGGRSMELLQATAGSEADLEAMLREAPPACTVCGDGLIRPGIVWFGEMLPAEPWDRAFAALEDCDLCLVVGTSGIVQPAASLPFVALGAGAAVVEVNPVETELSGAVTHVLRGPAGAVLPALLDPPVRARRAGTPRPAPECDATRRRSNR
mgnify:CR=1 FL=1